MSDTYPVLAAAPRMTLEQVERVSTVAFKMPPKGRRAAVQPRDPHHFRLEDPQHGFETPATIFSVVEARDGTVTRARVSPHLDYLKLDDAVVLVRELSERFDKAQWVVLRLKSDQSIRKDLVKSNEIVAGKWEASTWVMELRVKRAIEAGSDEAALLQFDEDSYLVTLVIWDDELL